MGKDEGLDKGFQYTSMYLFTVQYIKQVKSSKYDINDKFLNF